MKITVIGSGYVGLVSGACLAEFGHTVLCVDKDEARVGALKAGQIPIYEPGLADVVAANVRQGRLAFAPVSPEAYRSTDVIFLAVGTPSRRGDGHADLSFIYQAAQDLAANMEGFTVVATKSTVPVGTGDEVERIIRGLRPDADICVVSNPEFLREGAAIADFKHPDRIIIGSDDPRGFEVMDEVYRPLFLNKSPMMHTSRRAAELIKYAANAFLATKISFINQIADLCEKVGADVQEVARGIGLDNRIGSKFLHPGPGYGGSCFPKDTQALAKTAQEFGVALPIVEGVVAYNASRKRQMAERIVRACGGTVTGKTVALLGLAFKPNTDDMREAPSIEISHTLLALGALVRAFDPESMEQARSLLPGVFYCRDPYDCVKGAHAVAIVTEWDAFRALDLARIKSLVKQPVMVDLRNIYRPERVRALGFDYSSIGRV